MQSKLPYLLPVTILVAGLIIAISVYTIRTNNDSVIMIRDLAKLAPLTADDHILGNPAATITIITYTDIDCTYCKSFRETMEQIVAEYGADGRVAWVARHFPNSVEHPYAAQHAEAAECVYEQDPAAFFPFITMLNQIAPADQQFHPDGYPVVLERLSLSTSDFNTCIQSDRMMDRVTRDVENGLSIGVDATPYSVLLVEGKAPVPIAGALPYKDMKAVIETTLSPL